MRLSAQGDLIGFLVHFTRPEPALAIHGTVVKSDLPPGALRKQLYHVKLASKIFQLVMDAARSSGKPPLTLEHFYRSIFLFYERDPEGCRCDVRSGVVYSECDCGDRVAWDTDLGFRRLCVV